MRFRPRDLSFQYRLRSEDPAILERWSKFFLPKRTQASLGSQLADALERPDTISRALERLSPGALSVLSVLVDAGDLVTKRALEAELDRLFGRLPATEIEELSQYGLVLTSAAARPELGMAPMLAERMERFVPAAEPLSTDLVSTASSARFDEAVVLALVAGTRPRCNRDGSLNATDLRKLGNRLADTPRLLSRLPGLLELVMRSRCCRAEERVVLDPARAERHLGQSTADWWQEVARPGHCSWAQFRVISLLAGAGERWVPEESLLRPLRLRQQPWDPQPVEKKLEALAAELLVEQATCAAGHRYYRAPAAHPTTGKLVVQPSFEILAPPDTPPMVLAKLGQVAELLHADRFATFRLSETAAQAAIADGATIEELLTLLTEHAAHGVPQNVVETLRAWSQPPRRVTLVSGMAVQFSDETQRQAAITAMRQERIGFVEFGGALVVASWQATKFRRIARKLASRLVELDPGEAFDPNRSAGDAGDAVEDTVWPDDLAEEDYPELRTVLGEKMRAHLAAPPPPPSSKGPPAAREPRPKRPTRAALERAVRSQKPHRVQLDGRLVPVIVERLRQRGDRLFAELLDLERDEGRSLPVDEIEDLRPIVSPAKAEAKPDRNESCPCGSGRKYKRCCLAAQP